MTPMVVGKNRSTWRKNREFKPHQVQLGSWISKPSTVLGPAAFPAISSHFADLKPDQAVEIFFEHMDVPQMICFILKLFGKVIHPNLNPCLESGKNYLDKHIPNLGIHPKFPKFVPVTTRLRLRGGFDVSDLQEHVAPPRPAPPRAAEASGWLW